jgi:hypothetical protein
MLWLLSKWRTTNNVTYYGQISIMTGAIGVMFSDPQKSAVPIGTVTHTSSEEWVKYLEDQRTRYGTSPMGDHWSRVWGAFFFQNGNNVPFWFLVGVSVLLSGAPWRLRARFSLRTLLIATTLVAVVLGLIAWVAR